MKRKSNGNKTMNIMRDKSIKIQHSAKKYQKIIGGCAPSRISFDREGA